MLKAKSCKDEHFEKNLAIASEVGSLEEAAPMWRFSHFGVVDKKKDQFCKLCGTKIKKFVTIFNPTNEALLQIGHICYDKLIIYLATKQLSSSLLNARRSYIAKIKKYCKQYINESFLKWIETQDGITQIMRDDIDFINRSGYASNLEAAERLVEYYKTHYKFTLIDLMGEESWEVKVLKLLFRGNGNLNGHNRANHILYEEEYTLSQYEKLEKSIFNLIHTYEFEDVFFTEELYRTMPEIVRIDFPETKKIISNWIENAQIANLKHKEEKWKNAVLELQRMIAENQNEYLLLSFRDGFNKKRGERQWEAHLSGKKYILNYQSSYRKNEGPVLVKILKPLGPTIFLVSKLSMMRCCVEPMYAWKNS